MTPEAKAIKRLGDINTPVKVEQTSHLSSFFLDLRRIEKAANLTSPMELREGHWAFLGLPSRPRLWCGAHDFFYNGLFGSPFWDKDGDLAPFDSRFVADLNELLGLNDGSALHQGHIMVRSRKINRQS